MTAVGAVSAGLEARRRPLCSVSPPSISVLGRPPSGSWAGPEPRSSLGVRPLLRGRRRDSSPEPRDLETLGIPSGPALGRTPPDVLRASGPRDGLGQCIGGAQ